MRIIFIVSFILISFCSFSQTWEGSEWIQEKFEDSPVFSEWRIKKISDGTYNIKAKITTLQGDEIIGIGELKRYEKRTDDKYNISGGYSFIFQEFCNFSIKYSAGGEEKTIKGKCVLMHQKQLIPSLESKGLVENDGIKWFDWDDWDDKPVKKSTLTLNKVN